MYTISNVSGANGGECFLMVTGGKTALFDSGFDFCAPKTSKNIKSILKDRPLDYILLTHSHYDHASGSAYLKKAFPGVKVVAHEYAAKIMAKKSARDLMRELNSHAACLKKAGDFSSSIDDLSVDIRVKDGDIIDLGDLKLSVLETPGHTKCSISYYGGGFMHTCETIGVIGDYPNVVPCFIIGYEMALNAIARLRKLEAADILVSHYGLIEKGGGDEFFLNAATAAIGLKEKVLSLRDDKKSVEEIIEAYKREYYTEEVKKIQPERAFILNAQYMIPTILKENGYAL